jgi:hypothetical protein
MVRGVQEMKERDGPRRETGDDAHYHLAEVE